MRVRLDDIIISDEFSKPTKSKVRNMVRIISENGCEPIWLDSKLNLRKGILRIAAARELGIESLEAEIIDD